MVLGERENSVAASLIFPSVSCSRGAASVYDLIEDENCLHEAGQSEISSIRKSALGSFGILPEIGERMNNNPV